MISYSPSDISNFLGSRNRGGVPALKAIAELDGKTAQPLAGPAGQSPVSQLRRHADRICARASVKINEITSAELAALWLTIPVGRHAV